jgi:hypothetical protein
VFPFTEIGEWADPSGFSADGFFDICKAYAIVAWSRGLHPGFTVGHGTGGPQSLPWRLIS